MSRLLISNENSYLTTADLAARYRTAASTIRYWRHIGYGPKGIKVGRRVLYAQAEVNRFETALSDKKIEESA
ncbi:helix-turn-helix transcriptional regulator [Streptomyces sp. NPDC055025]